MKFRTIITFLAFVLFLLLSGLELVENMKSGMRKDNSSVHYVRSVQSPEQTPKEEPGGDYKKMLEASDVNG